MTADHRPSISLPLYQSGPRSHLTALISWRPIHRFLKCHEPTVFLGDSVNWEGEAIFTEKWHTADTNHRELHFLFSSSICYCPLLVTHFPWPACICVHVATHTHTHTPTLCLSPELYLSRVQTHMALVRPAPHRAWPYIYPTLLLRVTNMGTDRRRGWGVTQLFAHYVEWSLHSDDCVCDCCPNKYLPLHFWPKPGVAECQKMTRPTLLPTVTRSSFSITHPPYSYPLTKEKFFCVYISPPF